MALLSVSAEDPTTLFCFAIHWFEIWKSHQVRSFRPPGKSCIIVTAIAYFSHQWLISRFIVFDYVEHDSNSPWYLPMCKAQTIHWLKHQVQVAWRHTVSVFFSMVLHSQTHSDNLGTPAVSGTEAACDKLHQCQYLFMSHRIAVYAFLSHLC